MRFQNILYFVFAVFILGFGIVTLTSGSGKLWANIGICLIGLYFLYRGIALTVNESRRRKREEEDENNDPANA